MKKADDSKFRKPVTRHLNEDGSTRLFFDGANDWADYYMRGAICWPALGSNGFIIMAGQEIRSKEITVFYERDFLTIQNILNEDHTIAFRGIDEFFNNAWSRFFARKYFWHQPWELYRSFKLQITRAKNTINPQPVLVEVTWPDENDIIGLIWKWDQQKKLWVDKNGPITQAIDLASESDRQIPPAIHALQTLLAGIEKHPWRPGRS